MERTKIITMTAKELSDAADLIAEKAMELSDDGNDDSPDAALLWRVVKMLRS